MAISYLIAAAVIPLVCELLAVRLPQQGTRGFAFYLLGLVMGTLVYTGFLIITAHPYLALVGSAFFYFGLTAISNKKYQVLSDPFNAHDFDNARHLYIYPEFYISYVGWKVLALVFIVLLALVATSFTFENAIPIYELGPWYMVWPLSLLLWVIALRIFGWLVALFFTEKTAGSYGVSMDLQTDVSRFGLFPTILIYRILLKAPVDKSELRELPRTLEIVATSPADIIAIQGESFFNLERLFGKINTSAKWEPLRALEKAGVATGRIDVPTHGAYTMQSEFSFLSGLTGDMLGIDQINPYMRLAQKPVSTYVSALKRAGYRTLCIHPAKREFFRRSTVMQNLGFDEFIGLEEFEGAEKFGKYISDKALGDKINEIITAHHAKTSQPIFVFAITIESHGPWASGRLEPFLPDGTTEADLLQENIFDDPEFHLYQVHMENLLALYRRLSIDRPKDDKPRVVALYGDHMPAINGLFESTGFTERAVDYLLWNSLAATRAGGPQKIEGFAETVLTEAGLSISAGNETN